MISFQPSKPILCHDLVREKLLKSIICNLWYLNHKLSYNIHQMSILLNWTSHGIWWYQFRKGEFQILTAYSWLMFMLSCHLPIQVCVSKDFIRLWFLSVYLSVYLSFVCFLFVVMTYGIDLFIWFIKWRIFSKKNIVLSSLWTFPSSSVSKSINLLIVYWWELLSISFNYTRCIGSLNNFTESWEISLSIFLSSDIIFHVKSYSG